MKTTTKSGLLVKTGVKAGGLKAPNHNALPKTGLRVKTAVKAGGLKAPNHNAVLVCSR